MNRIKIAAPAFAMAFAVTASTAFAYEGTNCRAPGDCWEPKPGYPEKVA